VRDLPQKNDPRLVVGTEGFSDAGVFRVSEDVLMVQSLDFFAPLVDDPYIFGQIAATNSLSDVFAMGASPVTAMNIVCFPDDQLDLSILSEILKGGTEKVHQAGGNCVGGHSIRDNEIKFGLSVTGLVSEKDLLTNSGAKPGDALVLTKLLGTGFVTTAMKKGKCSQATSQAAIESMATLNKVASDAAKKFGAGGSTDITGFGLAIHATEMAQSSQVSLHIDVDKLNLIPGSRELVEKGFLTRANKTNREFSQSRVHVSETCDKILQEMVFDPQTSGGLLLSVDPSKAENLVEEIASTPGQYASIIGHGTEPKQFALFVQ